MILLPNEDERLERWEKWEADKASRDIAKRYTEVAKLITKEMKAVFRRLKSFDKPPAVVNLTDESLKLWQSSKRSETLRNSKEIDRSAAWLSKVGEYAAPMVVKLCMEVYNRNSFNGTFRPERWASDFYSDYSKPQTFADILRNGFGLLMTGVHALRQYGKRLAQLLTSVADKAINVLHGAAKRAQNWARMQWIRAVNAITGEEWGKGWDTQQDNRVRESHEPMNGQVRRWDEPFITGDGNYLMYPGDTSAPIKEWINCRCNLRRVRLV